MKHWVVVSLEWLFAFVLRFESWRLPAEDELQVFVFGTHLTAAAVDARLARLTRYPSSE